MLCSHSSSKETEKAEMEDLRKKIKELDPDFNFDQNGKEDYTKEVLEATLKESK